MKPLGIQFILSIFINLYMFQATMGRSSGETNVFLRHFELVILCGWLTAMQGGLKLQFHSTLHTTQSSTQNNKLKVLQKHICFCWWSALSGLKHVEIGKYTKNKLYTKFVLFTRLYIEMHGQQNIKVLHSIVQCVFYIYTFLLKYPERGCQVNWVFSFTTILWLQKYCLGILY